MKDKSYIIRYIFYFVNACLFALHSLILWHPDGYYFIRHVYWGVFDKIMDVSNNSYLEIFGFNIWIIMFLFGYAVAFFMVMFVNYICYKSFHVFEKNDEIIFKKYAKIYTVFHLLFGILSMLSIGSILIWLSFIYIVILVAPYSIYK